VRVLNFRKKTDQVEEMFANIQLRFFSNLLSNHVGVNQHKSVLQLFCGYETVSYAKERR